MLFWSIFPSTFRLDVRASLLVSERHSEANSTPHRFWANRRLVAAYHRPATPTDWLLELAWQPPSSVTVRRDSFRRCRRVEIKADRRTLPHRRPRHQRKRSYFLACAIVLIRWISQLAPSAASSPPEFNVWVHEHSLFETRTFVQSASGMMTSRLKYADSIGQQAPQFLYCSSAPDSFTMRRAISRSSWMKRAKFSGVSTARSTARSIYIF